MTTPSLDALIERLERADGPSREMDAEIARALGWEYCAGAWRERPDALWGDVPPWTASVDAALSLVPEGPRWWWTVAYVEGTYGAILTHYKTDDPNDGWLHHDHVEAPTPALALCIAALKARREPT